MRVCLIVPLAADLAALPGELQDVVNVFSGAGHQVHLAEPSREGLRAALRASLPKAPFDLVWFAGHGAADGLLLADGPISPVEVGRWLAAVDASALVANACYSAQHVAIIQSVAPVDVVATLGPAGDDEAAATALYLARELVGSGDLAAATRAASANGQLAYRFFPRVTEAGAAMRADTTHEDVAALIRALRGDEFTGSPGLIATVTTLSANVAALAKSIEAYRADTDVRLEALERASRTECNVLSRWGLVILLAVVAVAAVYLVK